MKTRTAFISGASRGIGLAIAKKLASEGVQVAITGKTVRPHPKLPGTLHTAAEEIEAMGGKVLPIVCDIREVDQIDVAVQKTVEHFGGIDICINNASAIQLTGTLETLPKRYDLMHQVNGRGTFMVSRACLPHLLKSDRAHIVNNSPPLDLSPKWFGPHAAYTVAKFNMSLFALGMAEEFKGRVAVNCIWPRTTIDTAAVRNLLGGDEMARRSRKPEVMADAVWEIVTQPIDYTGQFLIDENVLRQAGVTDFDPYAVDPSVELQEDFFLPED